MRTTFIKTFAALSTAAFLLGPVAVFADTPVDTTAPTITFIDPSPADGATIYTANSTASTTAFTFAFSVDDASSTVRCSITGTSDPDSFYSCGSPQAFENFPVGEYRFTVEAADISNNVASSSRSFTIAMGTTTATSSDTGSGDTGSSTPPTPATGGGGGNGQIVGSSPTAPGGSGSGSYYNPNIIIPTYPAVETLPESASAAPMVQVAPRTVTTASGSASSARGSSVASASGASVSAPAQTASTTAVAPVDTQAQNPLPTDGQTAAVAQAPISPAVWFWGTIIILALVGIAWLFYRTA